MHIKYNWLAIWYMEARFILNLLNVCIVSHSFSEIYYNCLNHYESYVSCEHGKDVLLVETYEFHLKSQIYYFNTN